MSWPCKTGFVRTPAPSATLKLQLPTATHSAVGAVHSDSANIAGAKSRQPMAATADSTLLWVRIEGMVAECPGARYPTSVAVCTDLYQPNKCSKAVAKLSHHCVPEMGTTAKVSRSTKKPP